MNILILALFVSLSAQARLITKPEAKSVLTNFQIKVYVKVDGSYSVDKTYDFEIVNAKAFNLTDFQIPYNSKTTKIKLLEGVVETSGTKVTLQPKDASTDGLSAVGAFDPLTVFKIKIPELADGSKLHLKFRQEFEKPLIPGLYSQDFNFITESPFIEKGNLLVVSEIPLKFKVRDPDQSLKVEHLKKKFEELKVTMVKPIVSGLKDEQQSISAPEKAPSISVGTVENWNLIKRFYSSFFELVMNATIPPEVNTLIKSVEGKRDIKDRLKLISQHIHTNFSYADSMRSMNGRPSVRMFSDLYLSKMADDKEMAALTVLVLKKLGHKADITLATRGNRTHFQGLPDPSMFNRALVKIEEDGEFYWFDPVQKISMGLNHPVEFSGRPSLSLGSSDSLEIIPFENFEESKVDAVITISQLGEGFQVQKDVQYSGQSHYELLSILKPEDLKDVLTQDLSQSDAQDFKLSALVNGKTSATYKLSELSPLKNLNTYFEQMLSVTPEWQGELYMGGPKEFKETSTYKVMVAPETKFACSVKSEWIDILRRSVVQKSSFVVYDQIFIKKAHITPEELKSRGYLALQNQLKECAKVDKIALKK